MPYKKSRCHENLIKFFPFTLLDGESLEPLIELQSPCSNTAASMGFYHTASPPPGYKDMHSCCSVAQKLNVISGIPPHSTNRIVLQEALQIAQASKLDFPISVRPLYSAPMHPFSGARLTNESSDVTEIVKMG